MTTAAPTRTILSERVVSNRRFAILQFQPATGALTTWSAPALAELAEASGPLTRPAWTPSSSTAPDECSAPAPTSTNSARRPGGRTGAAIATRGYDIFDAITRLKVPTVAVIQGPALGGALELALRADYRAAAASVKALGLPEVSLGLIPAGGGLTSLARLIGPTRTKHIAVTNSLNGKHLTAAAALEEGIVDVVLDDEDLLEAALQWTNDVLDNVSPVRNHAKETGAGSAVEHSRDTVPAAAAVTDLLARWQQQERAAGVPEGSPATAQASASPQGRTRSATTPSRPLPRCCNQTKAARASMPLTSCRKREKTTGPATTWNWPTSVWSEAADGCAIGLVFAEHTTANVLINDLDQERVDKALERVTAQLDRSVHRGRLTAERRDEIRGRIHGTVRLEDFYPCDIVIEQSSNSSRSNGRSGAHLNASLHPTRYS